MNSYERNLMEYLLDVQVSLRKEIKNNRPKLKEMSEWELRTFYEHYGECIGLEMALSSLGFKFESVDD